MGDNTRKVDAVFEGGGVKGIGLAGALAVTEEKGYSFENVAGTSAGAIVAALVAAGYDAAGIKQILDELDYNQFKDKGLVDHVPFLGPLLSLGFEKGIYEGDYLETWLRDLLRQKHVETFGDLIMEAYQDDPRYRYRLQVIAADVSRGRMLVLPGDLTDYGYEPDQFPVARAVRMSMSIPFFFEPVILRDAAGDASYIVDGGVLSNYPVWLLDDTDGEPAWPTLGYKLVEPGSEDPHAIRGPITLLGALFATMLEAHDARYIEDKDFARTIAIPTLGVKTTDFSLSRDRANQLYESGRQAAEKFFERWDFAFYKQHYRAVAGRSRRERLWSSRTTGTD